MYRKAENMQKFSLQRYRVKNFKSIRDSGWVNCSDVTTLIGVNEAGKSNLLLALWKLNPAKGGDIVLSDDMPISEFSNMRQKPEDFIFIIAEFSINDEDLKSEIATITGRTSEEISIVRISKNYSNEISISFPKVEGLIEKDSSFFIEFLEKCNEEINGIKLEDDLPKNLLLEAVDTISLLLEENRKITQSLIVKIIEILDNLNIGEEAEHLYNDLIEKIKSKIKSEGKTLKLPSEYADVRNKIIKSFPNFVYYSNYGNLDSEIYLPHVIENLKRRDLTGIDEAKARTLKVLFEFVNLDPSEILDMGTDAQGTRDSYGRITAQPTVEEIQRKFEKKKERNILLQSASTNLTKTFREWWKQGKYVFDLNADGKHFRILVSDDLRTERISLENRSTGLQWFLSFYLVFLVESTDAHSESILLLDEAGLSLHPLAQKDLSNFFLNLSQTNQIINTTHSPFLIDTNSIEKVKVVYVDDNGYSVVSDDLRASEGQVKNKSVYAIHAALGLSVSDTLLQGCKPVIVEGPSDQIYLNAIKLYLISKNLIAPSEEIVFLPSGGVRGVAPLSSLISSKNELPVLIVDSDKAGLDYKNKLEINLYSNNEDKEKIITIGSIMNLDKAEIEDIIPCEIMIPTLNRILGNFDLDFSDVYIEGRPIIEQFELYAKNNETTLDRGYKVDVARIVKKNILNKEIEKKYEEFWVEIFDRIIK